MNNTVNLCPSGFGVNVPFCGGKSPGIGSIVGFGISVLLFIALVAALGFLIYGGIRWIISGGDKENTAKAKGTVTSALIGLVIVLAAWILVNFVLNVLTGSNLGNINIPVLPSN